MSIAVSKAKKREGNIYSMIVFLIIALVFYVTAVIIWVRDTHMKRVCTDEVTGTVNSIYSRYETVSAGKHRTKQEVRYYIKVNYVYGGKRYLISPGFNVGKDSFKKGDKLTVMINPDDPDEVYIKEHGFHTGFEVIYFLIAGLAFTIVSVWVRPRRKRKDGTSDDWIGQQMTSEQDASDRYR